MVRLILLLLATAFSAIAEDSIRVGANSAVQTLWSATDSNNVVNVLGFSASGKYLAAGSLGPYSPRFGAVPLIRILEAQTGRLVTQITNRPSCVGTTPTSFRAGFTFWGDTNLVCWSLSNKFTIYSVPDGKITGEIILPMDAVDLNSSLFNETYSSFSPSGLLACVRTRVSSGDYALSIWSLRTSKLLHRFEDTSSVSFWGEPVISADEKYLAVYTRPLGYDCRPGSSFWSLNTFQPLVVPGFSDGTCLGPSFLPQFSPNNRFFVFPSWTIYDLNLGTESPSTYGVFTPDSKRIVTVLAEGNLGFVSVQSNAVEMTVTGTELAKFPPDIEISPRGDLIAYAKRDADGTVAVITNPFATVRVGAVLAATDGIQLQWGGGSGKYRLESTTRLSPATWQAVLNETMETAWTIPTSESAAFIRVVGLNP